MLLPSSCRLHLAPALRGWWRLVLATLLMAWGAPSAAAPLFTNCTPFVYSISPGIAGVINVPQQVGQLLYTGTVSATFNCTIGQPSQGYIIGSNLGSTTFVASSGKTLTLRPVSGSQSFTMSGAGNCVYSSITPTYQTTQTYLTVNVPGSASGNCQMTYSYNFEIRVATVPTVDVNFPPNYGPSASPTASPTCTFRSSTLCNWVISGAGGDINRDFANQSGAMAARFVNVGCTLSAASTTVTLPSTDVGSLAAPGSVAQPQSFNVTLTGCKAPGSALIANSTWTFTADPGDATMIVNSASSPAANVGVQIVDDTGTPVPNNGVVQLATITAAGSYSKTFVARYISKGNATAGAVTGVAQFTLSYQ